MKALFSIFLISLPFVLFAQESLNINISDLESNKGQVVLLLFKNNQEFGIEKQAYKTFFISDIKKQKVSFKVRDINIGEYAFLVYHDENKDGKFAANWLGIPKEGIGKSGVQHKRPNFKNSKFWFKGEKMTFNIKLKYLL